MSWFSVSVRVFARWMFSTAFITGHIPSLLMLFSWACLVHLLLSTLWGKCAPPAGESGQARAASVTAAIASVTLNPLSSGLSPPLAAQETVSPSSSSSFSSSSSRVERLDALRMWSMFLVNVVIVGSVNGFYIYSTLQSYSVEGMIFMQYAGACLAHTCTTIYKLLLILLLVLHRSED